MTVFVISDLHLGHKSIIYWRDCVKGYTLEEHDDWIVNSWNSVVKKRDIVWVLGDVAFSRDGLAKVSRLNGYKYLVTGNHDKFTNASYAEYFTIKPGVTKHKGMWFSHAPIHPDELRGTINVHGHVHATDIKLSNGHKDPRYYNVCVEALNGRPVTLETLKAHKAIHTVPIEHIPGGV